MNREQSIQKIIKKLNEVIRLHVIACGHGGLTQKAVQEQAVLERMIVQAIETDWKGVGADI